MSKEVLGTNSAREKFVVLTICEYVYMLRYESLLHFGHYDRVDNFYMFISEMALNHVSMWGLDTNSGGEKLPILHELQDVH